MKTYKIGDKEYNLITDYVEFDLGTWIQYQKVLDEIRLVTYYDEDSDLPKLDPLDELMLNLRILEVLCKVDGGELDRINQLTYIDMMSSIKFVLSQPKFNNVSNVYNHNGIDYVLPTDFDRDVDMGERISINTLNRNADQYTQWINILACLVRPGKQVYDEESKSNIWVRESFDVKNIDYRKELFKSFPMTVIYPVVPFFLFGGTVSAQDIADYVDGLSQAQLKGESHSPQSIKDGQI